jgi:serine/threonine protein kinase
MLGTGFDYYIAYTATHENSQTNNNSVQFPQKKKSNNYLSKNVERIDSTSNSIRDIKGLSEKLLVSEEKLQSKLKKSKSLFNRVCYLFGKKNTFDKYISKKVDKYKNVIVRAKKDYEIISKSYTDFSKSMVSEQMLMKIVRQSNLYLSENNQNDVCVDSKSLKRKKWKVFSKRTEDKKLHIIETSMGIKTLGKGALGLVNTVNNISDNTVDAIKLPVSELPKMNDLCRRDSENERHILSDFDSVEGDAIQAKPKAMFDVKTPGNTFFGLLQKRYEHGNLKDAIDTVNPNPEKYKKQGLQHAVSLFKGLKTIHDKGYVHGDIKYNNCFVGEKDGEIHIDIADFGGAKKLNNDLFNEVRERRRNGNRNRNAVEINPLGTTRTTIGYTFQDVNSSEMELNYDCSHNWIGIQKKRDTFAMASTVWFLLTKELPYTEVEYKFGKKYLNTSSLNNLEMVKKIYGENVSNILIKALSENPNDRPSIDAVIEVLQEELN